MAIQLEAYQWILVLITVISTVVGTVKILWGRIELNLNTNFKTVQNQLEEVSKQAAKSQQDVRELERKFYQFQIDLPHSYVAREDYIRGQTVIEAKLDALASKLETVQIKQGMAQK
ncbi:MAG: hypothetical protein RSC68_01270 [Acinetobacter sp.]